MMKAWNTSVQKTTIGTLNAAIKGTVWIVDSGATVHVSGDKRLFRNMRSTTSSVQVANGDTINIGSMGDISINLPGGSTLTLTNVLYVPGMKVNLLSTAMLREKQIGFFSPAEDTSYFEFKGQHVAYVDVVCRQYLLRTESHTAMELREEVSTPSTSQLAPPQKKKKCGCAFKVKKVTDIEIWHAG